MEQQLTRAENAVHRSVEVEYEEANWPDPVAMLREAETATPPPRRLSASDYAPAVDVLRAKGFSWAEIHNFLSVHGTTLSQQAIISSWRNWCLKNFGSSEWELCRERWQRKTATA